MHKHDHNETSELQNETIDYNEMFSWEWRQGRFGFGYYAGQISKDFRAATLVILKHKSFFTTVCMIEKLFNIIIERSSTSYITSRRVLYV
jgi:hypothetical protein